MREVKFSARALIPHRFPMPVNTVRVFPVRTDLMTYPVCPRCKQTMEREYQAFCNYCGQKLNWKRFSKAVILFDLPARKNT